MPPGVKPMKVALLGNRMLKLMVGMFQRRISVFFIFPVCIYLDLLSNSCFGLTRYTFCGLATMVLLNEVDKLDLASLIVRKPLLIDSVLFLFQLV